MIMMALVTYFSWWKSLDVQVLYANIFVVAPIVLLAFNAFKWRGQDQIPLYIGGVSKKITGYVVILILAGLVWSILWVGMSAGFFGIEEGTDFTAQQVKLADLESTDLFQTSVIRKVPQNTGEIRLRANRFGWADVIDTDPVYENKELLWRAVIEPHGLINQLTKSAPGVSETSAEIETSPVVIEIDLEYTEAKLFSSYSMRRAWYHNRLWLVGNGYLTTGKDGGYWWVYPRTSINWFIFTYKKEFEGVTLVNAKTPEIKHFNKDELDKVGEFLGKENVRVYPESLALQQASIYGFNRFGWWAKQVTQRSSEGESLYEIPGGQLRTSAGTWQKYPFLTVYNDMLYWVVVYEPIGGEISGARIAGILMIGADHINAGEITMLKFDTLEKNLPGVNKILRFARAEVQNFEGWIPQQVQIYQDSDNKLYALSSIVSGSGSGQRIMALAGVNLVGDEERAYVVKTSEYGDLDDAHSALLRMIFTGEIVEESVGTIPVLEKSTDERLDEIEAKVDRVLEALNASD